MQTKLDHAMSDAQIREAARLFGILAEPSRLLLLRSLLEQPQTVSELIASTGLKQGNVSKHLGVLHEAQFVERTKDGTFARYAVADPQLQQLCELMCGRIERVARERLAALAPARAGRGRR